MPRVVPDQKNKYETDELFKKLSQEVDVSSSLQAYTQPWNSTLIIQPLYSTTCIVHPPPLVCSTSLHILHILHILLYCVYVQVKFTGYRDRPVEERKRKFLEDLQEGHSVIVRFLSSSSLSLSPIHCLPVHLVYSNAISLLSCGGHLSISLHILSLLMLCVLQTFVSTGTNLNLQFSRNALQDDKPPNSRPAKESVDFDREPGKVRVQTLV